MIAALYVRTGGPYFNLPDVDPWDEQRDARKYAGPHPVVAHPPCQRWGNFWAGSPLVIARTGRREVLGDDGGCFQAALTAVRNWGGVLEHPWGSRAWPHFGICVPARAGGWTKADEFGGWTCAVEQGRYGHYHPKPTLLYVIGTKRPELLWGATKQGPDPDLVARYGRDKAVRIGRMGAKGGGKNSPVRIDTPPEFKALLLELARSVQ